MTLTFSPEDISPPDLCKRTDRLCRFCRLPGLGLGRITADGVAQLAVSGVRARGQDAPVSPDDSWHIGSITKSMTALLLARFVKRGLIRLDAPLGDLAALPLHPELARQSLRALLAHRAGLAANPPRAGFFVADLKAAAANERALRNEMLAPALLEPPRPGRFRYSNIGYMMAGHIAEQIGDAAWPVLLQQEIGTPLGLSSMGFGAPPSPGPMGHGSVLSMLVTLRGQGPTPGQPAEPTSPLADLSPAFGPAGLVRLTLADLLRYGAAVEALARGEDGIVPGSVFRDLITGQGYAGGWVITADGLRHDGSNGLWLADLRIRTRKRQVAAFVTNSGGLGALLAAWVWGLQKP